MIDLELAEKKAFEETFRKYIVKGCAFHMVRVL